MINKALQYRIADIFTQIQTAKNAKEMSQILQHRLLPLIQGEKMLAQEWERRVCYYRILSKEAVYINLIDDIHNLLKKISKKMDQKKLPNTQEDEFHNCFRYTERGAKQRKNWLSIKEMYTLMTSRKDWFSLNEGEARLAPFQTSMIPHQGTDDSFTAPWKYILKQYKIWGSFLEYAVDKYHTLNIDEPEAKELVLTLFAKTKELETMLERPSIEQCLPDFEWIHWYAIEGYVDNTSLPSIKERAVRIQKELEYFFLQHQEMRQEGKQKKKIIRSVKNGIITTMEGDEYSFKKKNSNSSLLCEKVYSYCQQVGDTVSIEKVFPQIWTQSLSSDPIGNKKKVYFACRSVNQWAIRKKIPALLSYDKEEITRCA